MKRVFDVLFASAIFLPVAAFTAVLAAAILAVDGFSPFYRQERRGRHGRTFVCCKLQTMRPADDPSLVGDTERDKERITRLGYFLRDRGWDELPQVWNVLRGEMSFIGPRPICPGTLERVREENPRLRARLDAWQERRETVRPGISGWHQITLRLDHSIVAYDEAYMKGLTLGERMRIIGVTAAVFFVGKDGMRKFVPRCTHVL